MIIALPSTNKGMNGYIEDVKKAKYYTFVEVNLQNKEILNVQVEELPFKSQDPGSIPLFIKQYDGELLIVKYIDKSAQDFFKYMGIKVLTGVDGKIEDIVDSFLNGEIYKIIEKNKN